MVQVLPQLLGGTVVYLSIEFNKDGSKKLEEISNTYVPVEETENETDETTEEITDETSEETTEEELIDETTEEENTETEKTITMKVDDEEIMTTSFDEPIKTGKLQLSVGSATTDLDTLQGYIDQASSMAIVLDCGEILLTYEVEENEYVLSDITDNELQIVEYVILGVALLALIVLIVRYKTLGILGAFSYIGLASILLLVIRYTNVVLSLEGIFGIVIVLILNYIFVNKILAKLKDKSKELKVEDVKNANKETYKEFFIKILPVIIMAITFCFIKWVPISSFGMVMFWGIALIAIYHVIVTNNLLKLKANTKMGGNK